MIAAFNDLALPFLFASAACLLTAALAWLALTLASRAWPVLAANRSVWLLSQLAIAAIFVLALLPQRAVYSVVPAIEVGRAAAPAVPRHLNIDADEDDAGADDPTWFELAAQAWLALYCAGLVISAARWVRARRQLQGLLAASHALDDAALAGHAGFAGQSAAGLTVLEIPAAISPMLVGLVHARLLLPAHLRSFAPEQQRLIVAHELAHWRRRDPLLLYTSLLLQTLFWFNPVLRLLGKKLLWAQELACDRAVLAGRSPHQRQHYAAALVAQVKLQHANPCAPGAVLAFGGAHAATMVARVRLIRQDGLRHLGLAGKAVLTLALAGLVAASVLFQPALAWHVAAPATLSAPASAPASAVLPSWTLPLERVRVTSFYGAPRKTGRPHRGIDFAAHKGTPVRAIGSGIVSESTDLYAGGEIYGKIVTIAHADGLRTFYAHLDARSVQVGDTVQAGQQIGTAGDTGRTTGPHLHLEAFDGAERIDPARLLTRLDAYATRSALRLRPAPALN